MTWISLSDGRQPFAQPMEKPVHRSLVLYACDNYGFSVPVGAVNVDKLTEPVVITWIEH